MVLRASPLPQGPAALLLECAGSWVRQHSPDSSTEHQEQRGLGRVGDVTASVEVTVLLSFSGMKERRQVKPRQRGLSSHCRGTNAQLSHRKPRGCCFLPIMVRLVHQGAWQLPQGKKHGASSSLRVAGITGDLTYVV